MYRRVDNSTNSYPWSLPTTEELWDSHAEGVLMVALTNTNLPHEAWWSARLLRAVPNCRLVLVLAYHLLKPALSIKEAGLMTKLQTPPDAGPSVTQATTGLQNWKRAGRRVVQIGGRAPTANQLHQSVVKILSKHLAASKRIGFTFQQKLSTMPMMNPSPTEFVELFTFATVAGHIPGVAAACAKARPKRANKVEVAIEEQPKEETQACGVTPRPKSKGPNRSAPPASPAESNRAKEEWQRKRKREKSASLSKSPKSDDNSASFSIEEHAKRETN